MKNSKILIYQNPDGTIKIDVRLEDETVWLTQAQLCELFHKSKATISEHIKNVFEEGELEASATVRNFRTVQTEGIFGICRNYVTATMPEQQNIEYKQSWCNRWCK